MSVLFAVTVRPRNGPPHRHGTFLIPITCSELPHSRHPCPEFDSLCHVTAIIKHFTKIVRFWRIVNRLTLSQVAKILVDNA